MIVCVFGQIGSAKTVSFPPRVSRLILLNARRSMLSNSGALNSTSSEGADAAGYVNLNRDAAGSCVIKGSLSAGGAGILLIVFSPINGVYCL